jgi:hypothetical protein
VSRQTNRRALPPSAPAAGVWQARTTRRLTREDEREIGQNILGFFRILVDWEARDDAARRRAGGGR